MEPLESAEDPSDELARRIAAGLLPSAFTTLLDRDWSDVGGNHVGRPSEVPWLLADACWPEAHAAREVVVEAGEMLYHQGDLSEASGLAAPYLLALAMHPSIPREARIEAASYLRVIAVAAKPVGDDAEGAPDVYPAVCALAPVLEALSPSEDPHVARYLLATYDQIATAAALAKLAAAHLPTATDDAWRAALVFAQARRAPEHLDRTRAVELLRGPDSLARTAAALALHPGGEALPATDRARIDAATGLGKLVRMQAVLDEWETEVPPPPPLLFKGLAPRSTEARWARVGWLEIRGVRHWSAEASGGGSFDLPGGSDLLRGVVRGLVTPVGDGWEFRVEADGREVGFRCVPGTPSRPDSRGGRR